jgi:tetratricopeptide (TPR) repeat protein
MQGALIGRLKIDLGEPAQALPHIELALRLSPRDPQRALWFAFAGLALLYTGEPAAAKSWLEKSLSAAPQFVTPLVFLAAAQQLEGHGEDARRTIAAVQRLSPNLSVTRVEQQFVPAERTRPEWSRIRESLRKAGLPD